MNSHAQDPTGLSYNVISLFFACFSLLVVVCVCVCRCLFMWVSIYVWTSVFGGQQTTIVVIFLRSHSPRSAFGLHTHAHTHVLNLHYAYTYHNAPICPTLLANEETKIGTTALCPILGTVPTAHTRLTHISRLHWELTETHISS